MIFTKIKKIGKFKSSGILAKRPIGIRKKNIKKRKNIPRALREQVWKKYIGEKYKNKCYISWCQNYINVFDFHVGHNIPDSKNGSLNIKNLKPICSRCNLSMNNNFTITQWDKMGKSKWSCNIL